MCAVLACWTGFRRVTLLRTLLGDGVVALFDVPPLCKTGVVACSLCLEFSRRDCSKGVGTKGQQLRIVFYYYRVAV